MTDPDWLREYKRECLLDEHRSLSSFVEKEIVMTTVTKLVTVALWVFALGRGWLGIVVAVAALWSVDVLYAYYGDVYKRRRFQVRAWLDALPRASADELSAWKTPANPFDGLSRSEKISVLTGTVASPAVSGIYIALVLLGVVLFVMQAGR